MEQSQMNETQNNEPKGFDIDEIASDIDAENNGRWFNFPGGASVKIARANTDAFNNRARTLMKKRKAILDQDDEYAHKEQEKLLIEVYAHEVIKDLRHFRIAGKPTTEYTPEIGIKLLQNRNFREKVKAYAEDAESFMLKNAEDAVVKD